MTTDRHSDLLLLLLAKGQTSVQDIATSLGASLATVRRDLIELEQIGKIERRHGSARIATGAHKELAFSAREQAQIEAKRSIAYVAAQEIQPDETLFLDASTTVLQLVPHIRNLNAPIKVFTNGLVAAQELAHIPHVDLTLIGGRVRAENLSMVGAAAIAMMEGLWFDRLFLGATAIDDEGRLTSLESEEAAMNAQMIKHSANVTVLADRSKFGHRATHAVARLDAKHTLISECRPESPLAGYIARAGLTFKLADVDA
ncbi:DeoR/GlpR family DNA-binding transcription regulator [Falsihalocynthiibacter sp. CO-5D18]|uniref:DeoR/GlpR family DNA-binding transcription regulator n=1 Tax=Falsihalocynthiibacter sp. CO-5D18 TaxID=3240872 RepID=UPI00350EADF5